LAEAGEKSTSTSHILTGPEKCHLCGLPVGNSKSKQIIDGLTVHFCCPGCLAVFQILFNHPEGPPLDFKETDLYRACVASGVISVQDTNPSEQENRHVLSTEKITEAKLIQELTLRVEGMWCTACSWLIEEVLRRTEGIRDVRVSFLSDMVRVQYFPQRLTPKDILAKISDLGYSPSLFQDGSRGSKEKERLLIRLGFSSILTMNTMMISLALYAGFFRELDREAIGYFSYLLWLLSTPVLFWGGYPILRRAYLALRYGKTSMDTLIAVGALSAYFYSVIQIGRGSLHLYFDTASMLVTLVLLGKHIEARTRGRVSSGLTELYQMAGQKVRLSTRDQERWISPEVLRKGDPFRVLANERIPVDGRILFGRAEIDESILTGESKPVTKHIGDEVLGGTLLLDGELKLEATRLGRQSLLGQMIELVQEALSKPNPIELLSDRIMRWFVPGVIALAFVTAFYLFSNGSTLDSAVLRAVTVLVITCPCALGIASPLAKVAAIGKGRERGILVRDPAALEQANEVDLMIFDKTGTLTLGNFALREVVAKGVTREEALRQIASVEIHSGHFLAREVIRKTREAGVRVEEARFFQAFEGLGVKGSVEGKEVAVGNRELMRIEGMDLPMDLDQNGRILEAKGETIVFFGWEGHALGFLVFGDSLKEGAGRTVQELQKRRIEVWLVSGDAEETTRAVAAELGIERFLGKTLPNGKVELIRRFQRKGRRVCMVGDGLNDVGALSQADVGVSLGTASNIAQKASDITLVTDDPARIIEVLDLSNLTVKTIHQNLLFAFCYNLLGIPLAVAGMINPLVAVSAMFASSLSVTGNTVRIANKSKVQVRMTS
jgi:heavy metal translocating P-type ATPase